MKKYIIIVAIWILFANQLTAQQDAHYSLNMFNGLFINPAYSGSREVIDVMAIYRHQWAGVQGAPRTGNGSIHAPMKKDQYALGLTIQGDRLGLTNSLGFNGSFAYRIKIKKSKLAIGISAGVTNYIQNNSNANSELSQVGISDAIFQIDRNRWIPNIGFGTYLYGEKYQVGFSIPHLLPVSFSKNIDVSTAKSLARQYNHYVLTAAYLTGKPDNNIRIRPSLLMKYVTGLNKGIPDFDLGLAAFIVERFMIGVNYRLGTAANSKYGSTGVAILGQVKITPQLKVGYAFEHTFTGLNRNTLLASHDIMIGYEFNTSKSRVVSPRFISHF